MLIIAAILIVIIVVIYIAASSAEAPPPPPPPPPEGLVPPDTPFAPIINGIGNAAINAANKIATARPIECPPGQHRVGLLCYENCNPDEEEVDGGIACRRKCPAGFIDAGDGCNEPDPTCPEGTWGAPNSCQKNWRALTPKDRRCPPGHHLSGLLCYENCNPDEDEVDGGTACRRKCPDGYSDNGLGCNSSIFSPCPEGTWGFPGLCQKNWRALTPKSLLDIGICLDGEHPSGLFCYDKCNPDEDSVDNNTACRRKCPPNFTDNGLGCSRPACPEGTWGIPTLCQKNKRWPTPRGVAEVGICEPGYHIEGLLCVEN